MFGLLLALVAQTCDPVVFANNSLLDPGLEQSTGSVQPFGGYQAFPGLAQCGSSTAANLGMVFRRNLIHGTDFNNGAVRLRRSLDGGRGWIHNRTNEINIESGIMGSDPYTTTIMRRQNDGHWFLKYERDFAPPAQPTRLTYWRESADCGETWGPANQLPSIGGLYTSAGGPCIELPWGVGAGGCPGTGCAVLCPDYYRTTAVGSKQIPFVYRSDTGFGGTFIKRGEFPCGTAINCEEPQVELIPGVGQCGKVATSSSCLLGLTRDDDYGIILKTFSTDSGNTWQPPTFAFTGIGFPAVKCDDDSGWCLATTRDPNKADLNIRNGKPAAYLSTDRGLHWDGPVFFGYPEDNGQSIASLYSQIIDRGDRKWGVAYAQEAPTGVGGVRLAYVEAFARSPASEEIAPGSPAAWLAPTAPTRTDATFGSVSALHGATRFACGLWYRNDTTYQMEYLLRYGGLTGSGSNSFYIMRQNGASPRFEVMIASGLNAFDRLRAPLGSSVTDTWEAMYFLYDGAGAGNSGRLRLARNGVDLTPSSDYVGAIPAAMTSPGSAVFRIGSQANGSDYVRGSVVDHVACWAGSSAPSMDDFAPAALAWWNQGNPQITLSPTPNLLFPLDSSFENAGALNIGSPSVVGTPVFVNNRQPGPGYLR